MNETSSQEDASFTVGVSEGDLLEINRASPHLFAMRPAVSKLAERPLQEAAMKEQQERRRQAYDVRQAERRKRDRETAKRLRRTVLRVVPEKNPPAAAALLNIGTRSIQSCRTETRHKDAVYP